jgi:hydroxyacylglutathione hydrolase
MHVVTVPPDPIDVGDVQLHIVPAARDNLVWLVVCRRTGEAAVVDGPTADEVLAYADARGIRIGAVWNTHTHGDHIGINRDLLAKGRLPARVFGPAPVRDDVPGLTDPIDEGDTVPLGASTAKVWRTDGHLHGHVSFVLPGLVLCGDTMFGGGCGRVLGGTHAQLFASLMRLAELPGDTLVCCAHEYTQDNLRFAWAVEADNAALMDRIRRVWAIRTEGRCAVPSTIEEERATNPFLRPGSPTILAGVRPEDRVTPVAVFAALRTRKDAGAYRSAPEPAPVRP